MHFSTLTVQMFLLLLNFADVGTDAVYDYQNNKWCIYVKGKLE
jgi:hypothetical protein